MITIEDHILKIFHEIREDIPMAKSLAINVLKYDNGSVGTYGFF